VSPKHRLPGRSGLVVSSLMLCTLRGATLRPNPSLKLTRYGSRRLAAPGAGGIMPSAAKRRLPPRAA
jgi:hypothetical protein